MSKAKQSASSASYEEERMSQHPSERGNGRGRGWQRRPYQQGHYQRGRGSNHIDYGSNDRGRGFNHRGHGFNSRGREFNQHRGSGHNHRGREVEVGRGGWSRGGTRGRGRGRGGRGRGQKQGNVNWEQFDINNIQPAKKSNFYCCSCERGFKTEDQLNIHNTEHIVCGLEGCTFEAHSLVVTKHIRMQHEGNLFQRMKNLSTPDDILRWREERKKNFPTTEKLEEKAKLQEEMETQLTDDFGNANGNRRSAPFRGNRGNQRGRYIFRYRIEHQQRNRDNSYAWYQRQMRRLDYEQSDQWTRRMFAPDRRFWHVRVPFFSLNKSKIVTLEDFYFDVKMGSDGKVKKETKVKWERMGAKTLERLPESESEEELNELPISDDEDDVRDDKGGQKTDEKQEEKTSLPLPQTSGLGMLLVDYSSNSDSENEATPKPQSECNSSGHSANITDNSLQSAVVGTTTITGAGAMELSSKTRCLSDEDDDYDSEASDQSMTIDEFKEEKVFKDKPVFTKFGQRKRRRPLRCQRLLQSLLYDAVQEERSSLLDTCRFIKDSNLLGNK